MHQKRWQRQAGRSQDASMQESATIDVPAKRLASSPKVVGIVHDGTCGREARQDYASTTLNISSNCSFRQENVSLTGANSTGLKPPLKPKLAAAGRAPASRFC